MMSAGGDERHQQRRFDRQAEAREVERERRLAHAEPVHRDRQHLHDERDRHDDREVARTRRRRCSACATAQIEGDDRRLHEDRAGEAAGERAGLIAEARQRAGELLDPVADPFRVKDAQRLQQASEARPARAPPARDAGRADEEAGPEPQRPDRQRRRLARAPAATSRRSPRPAPAPSGRAPRSTRTTVVASVFEPAGRAVSRMRMTSPPILLGRKLLKKVATRNEPSSDRAAHVHVLRVEQQTPAPGAGARR